MASKFRTKDGGEVRVGDKVWAQVWQESDNNPWLITQQPLDKTHLILKEIGGTEERVHHPDDLALYYYANWQPPSGG
ncbi:hypothetical protein ACIRYZ_41885 [Kitasatospora sp. NPDC101155]|uniref:hypothetical protein n=1 Tax=Kitasatospora sp. NPDC101155 TaxID=3364097 RepID=UPI003817847D